MAEGLQSAFLEDVAPKLELHDICLLGCTLRNLVESSGPAGKQEWRDFGDRESRWDRGLQLVAVDINDRFTTDEIDYRHDPVNNSHTFTPAQRFVIGLVTRGDSVLWDSRDYGFEYGTKLFVGDNERGEHVFRIYFPGPVPTPTQPLVKPLRTKPEPIQAYSPPQSPESDTERDYNKYLIAVNVKYRASSTHITYERDEEHNLDVFTAHEPYRFVLAISGAHRLWRYSYGALPNRAIVHRNEDGESFLRLDFASTLPQPPGPPQQQETKLDEGFRAEESVEEETEDETETEAEEMVEKPKSIDPAKFRELDRRRKIDLDVKKRESSEEYWYSNSGTTHVYSANNNFLFEAVKIGDFRLWAARDKSDYANKVEYNNYDIFGMKDLAVSLFVGGKRKFIKYKSDPWTEIDLTKFNLVTINVKSTFSTYGYFNRCEGASRTFTAKQGFLFDRVIRWSGPSTRIQTIWQARDPSEYARAVVVDGAQPSQNANNIVIHFPNKKKKHLVRINGSWFTYYPFILLEYTGFKFFAPMLKTLFKVCTSLLTACCSFSTANGTSQSADGSSQPTESSCTTNSSDGNDQTNGGSDGTHTGGSAQGRGITHIGGGSSVTKTGIELNLESTAGTDEYDRNEDTNKKIVTFTPKDNIAFKLVKKGNDEIWKTDKADQFASKVELHNYEHDGEHDVTITLPDQKSKKFIKPHKESWKEIDPNGKTTVTMNVNSEKESCKYSITKDGTKRTYEAKAGIVFNTVLEWDGSTKYDIWSTSNQAEYSKKVVREDKKVTIDIGDGAGASTKVFTKESDGKWKENTNNSTKATIDQISTNEKTRGGTTPANQASSQPAGKASPTSTVSAGQGFSTPPANEGNGTHTSSGTGIFTSDDGTGTETGGSTYTSCKTTGIDGSSSPMVAEPAEGGSFTGETFESADATLESTDASAEYNSVDGGSTSCGWSCIWNIIKGWFSSCGISGLCECSGWCSCSECCGSSACKTGSEPPFIASGTSIPKTGVDVNIKKNTKSSSKFDYKRVGQYVIYTPKDNYVFKLVKDDKTEVWKTTDTSIYSIRVEVDDMGDSSAFTVYLPENKIRVFKKDCRDKTWHEINLSRVNYRSISIKHTDETYKYKNELEGNTRTFTAKPGFAFRFVYEFIDKDNRPEIWKTTNPAEYSKKVVVEGDNKVTIYTGDGTVKVIERGPDGKWPGEGTGGSVKADEVLRGSGIQPAETSSNSSQTPQPEKEGVDVNIKKNTKSTDKFEYKRVGQYVTYTAKDNYAFKCGKDDNTELWEATDVTHYSDKVEVDLLNDDSKAVTFYLPENKTRLFKKDGKIDTSKINPHGVNIDYIHESYSFTNVLKGRFRTFTPKSAFIFNCANEYVDCNKVEVWKAVSESDYSNKIEVDYLDNNAKAVTIHLPGDRTLVFKKDGIQTDKINPKPINIDYPHESYYYTNKLDKNVRSFEAKSGFMFNRARCYVNSKWVEIWKAENDYDYAFNIEYTKHSSGSRDLKINMKNGLSRLFINENSTDPWKELDMSKMHTVAINIGNTQDCYSHSNELKSNIRTYSAKYGFGFHKVFESINNNNIEIWSNFNEFDFSNKIEVDLMNKDAKAITVHLPQNKTRVFKKDSKNDPWNEIFTNKLNAMPIIVDYPHDSYFFTLSNENNIRTFTAKNGFIFNCARCLNNNIWADIWKTDNEEDFSRKVEVEKDKVTVYLGQYGIAKVFNKDSQGKWTVVDHDSIMTTKDINEVQSNPTPDLTNSSATAGFNSFYPSLKGFSQDSKSTNYYQTGSQAGLYPSARGMTAGIHADSGMPSREFAMTHGQSSGSHILPNSGPYSHGSIGHSLSPGSSFVSEYRDQDASHRAMSFDSGASAHAMPSGVPYATGHVMPTDVSDPGRFQDFDEHGMVTGHSIPFGRRSEIDKYLHDDGIGRPLADGRRLDGGYAQTSRGYDMASVDRRIPYSGSYSHGPSGHFMTSPGIHSHGPSGNVTPTHGGQSMSHVSHVIPTPGHVMPGSTYGPTSPGSGLPAGRHVMSTTGHGLPAHGHVMQSPAHGMQLPSHGMSSPGPGLSPGSHNLQSPVHGLPPGSHGMKPSGHSMPYGRQYVDHSAGGLHYNARMSPGSSFVSEYRDQDASHRAMSFDSGASAHAMPSRVPYATGHVMPTDVSDPGRFQDFDEHGMVTGHSIPFGRRSEIDKYLHDDGIGRPLADGRRLDGGYAQTSRGYDMASVDRRIPYSGSYSHGPSGHFMTSPGIHSHGPSGNVTPTHGGQSMSHVSHVIPTPGHVMPGSTYGPTSPGSGLPAGRHVMSTTGHGLPAHGHVMQSPAHGMQLPSHGMSSPGPGLSPGSHNLQSPVHGLPPGSHGMKPSGHSMPYGRQYVDHSAGGLHYNARMSPGSSFVSEYRDQDASHRAMSFDSGASAHAMPSGVPYATGHVMPLATTGLPPSGQGFTPGFSPEQAMPPGSRFETSHHAQGLNSTEHGMNSRGHGKTQYQNPSPTDNTSVVYHSNGFINYNNYYGDNEIATGLPFTNSSHYNFGHDPHTVTSPEVAIKSKCLLEMFKVDQLGNPTLMVEGCDFSMNYTHDDLRFEIRQGINCTLVSCGNNKIWQKGEHDIEHPKIVAFNETVNLVALRDNERTVFFKLDPNINKWAHYITVEREQRSPGSHTISSLSPSSAEKIPHRSDYSVPTTESESPSIGIPEAYGSVHDDYASYSSGRDFTDLRPANNNILSENEHGFDYGGVETDSGGESPGEAYNYIVNGNGFNETTIQSDDGELYPSLPSTPTEVSTTHENGGSSTPSPPPSPNYEQSYSNVNSQVRQIAEIKLLKDDGLGHEVYMEPCDYTQENYLIYQKYDFNQGIKCLAVVVGDKYVWRKGNQNINILKTVSYNSSLGKVVLSDEHKFVFLKMDHNGNWVSYRTIPRSTYISQGF
ncbi:uncharacterized protein TOT_030000618 [Theileria orientalis strain Shintoku]|uniref:Uncharacterized protein n=1 Tax=Theileria orientalis strain Shintoku TaxID=869250 RepID=J4C407_THEOR|nr:uncharacterized protein TOT_030000618 [Theileria orientalis strain Shintoku]BAM41356.1 uncharacterized protein TOT_030000618 [Theileria orientalis strain Shintoku]|eukprot:XP_009691657.1 uncharacterized protein TOT_030000618 [Theileria orientalis strain Shintoku]